VTIAIPPSFETSIVSVDAAALSIGASVFEAQYMAEIATAAKLIGYF